MRPTDGKKSHFDVHKQDKHFFRCVGNLRTQWSSFAAVSQPSISARSAARPMPPKMQACWAPCWAMKAYSSHLGTWSRQRKQGGFDALTPKRRGPKVVVNPLVKRTASKKPSWPA